MPIVKRTQNEIDAQVNTAAHFMDRGTKYGGMSYDEGVRQALDWIQGHDDDPPYDEQDVRDAANAE